MNFAMKSYLAATFCLASAAPLSAAEVLVSPTMKESGGIRIAVENIPSDGDYTDATYKAFRSFRNKDLFSEDYYYTLRVYPSYKRTLSWCDDAAPIAKFLNQFFGTSKATLDVLRVGIEYRYTSGNGVAFAKEESPATLFMIGRGEESGTLKPGNGCFLNVTSIPTYPLFRYGGGGQEQNFDDFNLKFSIASGKVVNSHFLEHVNALFTRVGLAASFVPLAGAAATAIAATSQDLDGAIGSALNSNYAYPVSYVLKQGQLIRVSLPGAVGLSGSIVMYPRRFGSIALDTADPKITAQHVLNRSELAARGCDAPSLVNKDCSKNNQTIKEALAIKIKLKDNKVTPIAIFDPSDPSYHKYALETCKQMRSALVGSLRLSTLDEMVVRWAILKDSQFLDVLKNEDRLKEVANAGDVSPTALIEACWNKGDDVTVKGVIAKLGKAIE